MEANLPNDPPGPAFVVQTDRIGLATPTREEYVERWRLDNDPELAMLQMLPTFSPGTPNFPARPPVTRSQRERQWEGVVERAILPFDIWDLEQQKMVGEVLLNSIQWPHAMCEIAVRIFDPADRGRGVGTEATKLVMAYGFDGLGLHRMCIRFLAVNPAVVGAVTRWAASFGAKPYGRERESVYAFGGWQDVLMFDVLAHEFPPQEATAALRSAPPVRAVAG